MSAEPHVRRRNVSELDGWEILAAHAVSEGPRRAYLLVRKGRQSRDAYLCIEGAHTWLEIV